MRRSLVSVLAAAAREAYNLVRAAEDGLRGDPDLLRDYEVTQPLNKQP